MTVDELPGYLRVHWPRLREELLAGRSLNRITRIGLPTMGTQAVKGLKGVKQIYPTIFDIANRRVFAVAAAENTDAEELPRPAVVSYLEHCFLLDHLTAPSR